uniref:Uncharacterized protein n=1 Tax=Avena sativa TaxID=4498 RepID=A0ACD5TCM9_AVESA
MASGVLAAKLSSLAMFFLLLLVLSSPPACHGGSQNITAILAAHPDLGEFSSLLTSAGLADNISQRKDGGPVTVLAVNDTAMASLKNMPREAIWGHLSLHVLLDCYYDDAKLQGLPLGGGGTVVSTLFHAAGGGIPGVYGMVKVFRVPKGRGGVGFLPMAGDVVGAVGKAAFFVKSVYGGAPYSLSVLQVSGVMST